MKSILLACAFASLVWLGTAPTAQARTCGVAGALWVSGYCPDTLSNYSERYLVGYDPYGRPVWGLRTVRRHHHPVIRTCLSGVGQAVVVPSLRIGRVWHRPHHGEVVRVIP